MFFPLPRPVRFYSARLSSCLNTPVCLRPVEELADLDQGPGLETACWNIPSSFGLTWQPSKEATWPAQDPEASSAEVLWGPSFPTSGAVPCPVISLPARSFFLYCRHQLTFHGWLLDLNNVFMRAHGAGGGTWVCRGSDRDPRCLQNR